MATIVIFFIKVVIVSIKESGMNKKREVNLKTVKRFARLLLSLPGQRVNITNGERFRRIVLQIKMLRFHTHGN